MTRIGWKLVTVVAIVLAAANLIAPSPIAPSPVNAVREVLVLVGLVGYSWGLAIGPRWIWKLVFCFEALALLALWGFVLWMMEPPPLSSGFVFIAAALLFMIGIPVAKLYALYRYGFGSSPPWIAAQPSAP